MSSMQKASKQSNIYYVTRDLERALGVVNLSLPDLYIITNYTPYTAKQASDNDNIILIRDNEILDTWQLLEHPETILNIKNSGSESAKIIVFKNTTQIEKIAAQHNWQVLNPPAVLINKIEQKISQLEWAKELIHLFPPYEVKQCRELIFQGTPFILQFNHSHTGSGTMLIKNTKQLKIIIDKFPQRQVRIAPYIQGPLFTNNNIIWEDNVLCGNISYQITGLKPFTKSKFAGIGNDWLLPQNIFSKKQFDQFYSIAKQVGRKMQKDGFYGAFGIDVVLAKDGQMYLLEVNARQPASTSYESFLQTNNNSNKEKFLTTFEAHIASLEKKPYNGEQLLTIDDGAQIIYRYQGKKISRIKKRSLKQFNFDYLEYDNDTPNADLLRIYSSKGLMADHNKFNKNGNTVKNIVRPGKLNLLFNFIVDIITNAI